ncbi:MAG: IPT/TIG domain-containing protein [Bradymonadaceae bacterium]|nr:IPT/TIG domain-containing protein [Lujinxingiaceae bacterium]
MARLHVCQGALIGLMALVLAGCPTDTTGVPPVGGDTNPTDDTWQADGDDDATSPAGLALVSLTPSQGVLAGGTRVSLSGTGFAGGAQVWFGDTLATQLVVSGTTSIEVTSPAASGAGAVSVTVALPNGTSTTLANAFTYVAGEIATIEYCLLQAQSPVTVETGQQTELLHALVFVEGVTQGEGQGTGITGELGWGAASTAVADFNFVSMTYQRDFDGLTPGDKSNDEYAAQLNVSAAGEYRYLARFKLDGESSWTYCDLNGIGAGALGVIVVEDPVVSAISHCRTETSTLTVQRDLATSEITGVVFAAGITAGEGQGAGITSEIVWGAHDAAPSSWTMSAAATYKEDADGLFNGDRSNDRYRASLTLDTVGTYGFAYRFSLDGGTSWSWCDTDGSDGTASGFDATQIGTINVVEEIVELADYCRIQWPHIVTGGVVGEAVTVYGRVVKEGITDVSDGDARIVGELLVGPSGANPMTALASFSTTAATLNTNENGQYFDEYQAAFTPTSAGSYSYFYRFSVDSGQTWSYCDLLGASDGRVFEAQRAGALVVADAAPDLVDYCRVWQLQIAATTAQDSPIVTVETYDATITDGQGGANASALEVEVGYGADGANPGVSAAYTWNATGLLFKGVHPTNMNNYEYEGGVYADTAKPGEGVYNVAVRIRKAGEAWAYCDTDETTMHFAVGKTTLMTISVP